MQKYLKPVNNGTTSFLYYDIFYPITHSAFACGNTVFDETAYHESTGK
jgi:hypothetical protein